MTPSTERRFHVTRQSGSVLVHVHGDLDLRGSGRLGAALGDLIDDQGNRTVGVDLRGVTGLDAGALGVFAAAAQLAANRGGALTVAGLAARGATSDAAGPPADDEAAHLVHFFKSDDLLADSVRRHLEPALRKGDGVVVVATGSHRDLFEATLIAAGIDVERARAESRYLDVDAMDTLSLFMVDSLPDPNRFRAAVGDLIGRVSPDGVSLRVYGEMVAVLWAEGNVAAAIALEDLWNELGRTRRFALLCAYPATAFATGDTARLFRTICSQHS